MSVVRAPTSIVLLASYGCIALMLAAIFLVQSAPRLGASFIRVANGQIAVVDDSGQNLGTVPPDSEMTFAGPDGAVRDRAERLAGDFVPRGSAAENADAFNRRTQLAALAERGAVNLLLPGVAPPGIRLASLPRQPWDLGFNFWALLLTGAGGSMIGAWVWALRPRDWGARMFALSGVGLMISALSAAVFEASGPATNGATLSLMFALNIAGAQFCGAALIAQGLCYPRQLVRPLHLLAVPLLVLPVTASAIAGWISAQMLYAAMFVEFLALLVLMGLQWRLARRDPLARAALRWIGLSTALGTSGFVIVNVAPSLFGQAAIASDGVAFLLLFVIYAGTALGVGRYRLFDLDRWAYRVVLAIAGSLALLLIDGLLVLGLRFQPQQALGLSLAATGLVYLPARGALLARLTGRSTMSAGDVLEAAEVVRFTADADLRRGQWRDLLQKLFDPLEISSFAEAAPLPAVRLDGLELVIPAAAGSASLVLRYPSQGRTLFSAAHVRLVSRLVTLMERADSVRDGYARGVVEERSRIARDLHDDVSARLLTGLYRPSTSLIREDVRTAMSDLRTIMRGLAGEQQPAQQVLATLRHETSTRLEAAGITLSWPIELVPTADPLLDYTRYKNLTSAHREVVTNILRHAAASHVEVSSICTDLRIFLAIEDNGRGHRPNAADDRGGAGIGNIRRRLEEIGGSVNIPGLPSGFRVELELPLGNGALGPPN